MYNELRMAVKKTNFWTSQFLVTNIATCFGLIVTIFRPQQRSYIAETTQPYSSFYYLVTNIA
jgi:hypothetical protein